MQRIDAQGRALTPALFCIMFVILSVVPLPSPGGTAGPAFVMMAVYYWTIQRPDLLPAWAVFSIGLFEDLLTGGRLGVAALTLLIVHIAVAGQRRFFLSRPFAAAWWGFMIVAGIALLLQWIASAIAFGHRAGLGSVVFQYALSLALYPAVAWLMALVQKHFVRSADDD